MIYLDYAATNPWGKYKCFKYDGYFNVNANYAFTENKLMQECEERGKTAIGAKGGKVVFGGTASQLVENLFTHIAEETPDYLTVSSIYEHDAVFRFADQWGSIDSLRHVIQTYKGGKQLIVCLMGVNNVTGRVFNVEGIGRLCHKYDAFFICDMTAMIGHAPIPDNIDDWCDCAFWSGHKIGTELGIGAMWLSKDFNNWLGDFKLHGTPNVAGALAITDATEAAVGSLKENYGYWVDLYCLLIYTLNAKKIKYQDVLGDYTKNNITLAINAIRINGINARALQFYLASKYIYIGLGQSSCAEETDRRVLCDGFGLSKEEADEVIRISFGERGTIDMDDITILVTEIKNFIKEYGDNESN